PQPLAFTETVMTIATPPPPHQKRPSRAWIWFIVLPFAGFFTIIATLFTLFVLMVKDIEKSPGYALASATVTSHPGVKGLLGAPVRVTRTKAKNITKKPTGTTLELSFELEGSLGKATADVVARQEGGPWIVSRATIASRKG